MFNKVLEDSRRFNKVQDGSEPSRRFGMVPNGLGWFELLKMIQEVSKWFREVAGSIRFTNVQEVIGYKGSRRFKIFYKCLS